MEEKLNSKRCLFTNADRIRAMTDEELAEWVGKICDCDHAKCPIDEAHISCVMGCERAWLNWLKQEAQCTSE